MEGSYPNATWYPANGNDVYYPDDAHYYSSHPYYNDSMGQWNNQNVQPAMEVPIMRQQVLQYPQMATTMAATNEGHSSVSNEYLDQQNVYSQQFQYQLPNHESSPASTLSNSTASSQYSTSPPDSQESLSYCYEPAPIMSHGPQPIQPPPVLLPEQQYSQAPIPTSSFNPQHSFTIYPDNQITYPSQLQYQEPPSQSPPASYSSSSCSSRSSTSPIRFNSQEPNRRRCGRPRVYSAEERHQRKLESANRSRRKKNDNLKMLEKSVEIKQNALKRMSTMHDNLLDLENALLGLA